MEIAAGPSTATNSEEANFSCVADPACCVRSILISSPTILLACNLQYTNTVQLAMEVVTRLQQTESAVISFPSTVSL